MHSGIRFLGPTWTPTWDQVRSPEAPEEGQEPSSNGFGVAMAAALGPSGAQETPGDLRELILHPKRFILEALGSLNTPDAHFAYKQAFYLTPDTIQKIQLHHYTEMSLEERRWDCAKDNTRDWAACTAEEIVQIQTLCSIAARAHSDRFFDALAAFALRAWLSLTCFPFHDS